MHMLSNRIQVQKNWRLCEDRGTPQRWWASGEVPTNEEAQVYVHDLHLFVTVQIFDDMPAVLSLGKLCEDPGCSVGQRSKATVDQRREEHFMQNGKLRTSWLSLDCR